MNDAVILGSICLVASLLGAGLGAALVWRAASLRMPSRWAIRFQEVLEPMLRKVAAESVGRVTVPSSGPTEKTGMPASMDLRPLANLITAQIETGFDVHDEAQDIARATAHRKAELSLDQALQRMPLLLQQAIKVELEFHRAQQAQRDQARAAEHERWLADMVQRGARADLHRDARHEARCAEIRTLLQALGAADVQATGGLSPSPRTNPRSPSPSTGTAPAASTPMSARPPEILLTPLARAGSPDASEEPPPRELTDAELDALPPELPAVGLHKRIQTTPPKRVLRNL